MGAGRAGNPSRICWSAAGAPFNLFHEKISVVVVAGANQAKFWLSYLRTKLCNSPSFPRSLPACHPMFPLVRDFFSLLFSLVLEHLSPPCFAEPLDCVFLLCLCWVLGLLKEQQLQPVFAEHNKLLRKRGRSVHVHTRSARTLPSLLHRCVTTRSPQGEVMQKEERKEAAAMGFQ